MELRTPRIAGFPSFEAHLLLSPFRLTTHLFFPNRTRIPNRIRRASVNESTTHDPIRMAAAAQNGTCESVQEPSPKFQKQLPQNGAAPLDATTHRPLPLLKVKKLSDKAVVPKRGSALAAGYDLSSAAEVRIPARGKALIPTDLSISIPPGTYARVAPRSGLAWKHSIDVGAGVIDADYRGPVGVVLFNHSDADFEVKPGDRVAQLIIELIVTPEVVEVDDLDTTVRGAGGFGSTGV